ncbi:hypothetical protein M3Y96_00327600 [Aphelenchoides besseyi]|nr:hypothetical protein M3Y96_00327600 [Aphelenchoides besseyi]
MLRPTFLVVAFCAFGIAAQSIPLISECESGTSPVFLLQHNSTVGARLRQTPTQNFIECAELCSTKDDCVGVEYADGACHQIGAGRKDERYEQVDESAPLATKSCVKSERICASPFHFDVHEQKILVGFAREVVPADSIHVCLSACLNAFDTFGFECESVMYYPLDAECILNTEDRLDRPDLFIDEHDDTVVYLDNNCAGSQCYAPYVTQYTAVEGRQLREELDHSFTDLDMESCEQLCTQRVTITKKDFNCKSFMYNNATRTCILSDERSTPLGRANLTDAPGFTYYEKKCFASPRTCRNVASFTRTPQMLLVGFAAFVMENVPSMGMCLDQCTNPPPETGEKFVCKSAMYYYNEQECILNAESRATKPDLFIPEEDDFVVDYFDINCHLQQEKCPGDSQLHSVRSLNAALPEGEGSLHVIETLNGGVAECARKCYELAPEKCRSFNYDKESKLCNLLYLDGKTTLRPQVKTGVDLYDLHCLTPPTGQCQNRDGAVFSRYLYTKQPGIAAKEQSVISLSSCLQMCLSAERCEGVNYNRRTGTCSAFTSVEQQNGVYGAADEHVDFYTNLCQHKEIESASSSGAANVPKDEQKEAKASGTANRINALNELPAKKNQIKDKEPIRFKPTETPAGQNGQVGNAAGGSISAPEANFEVKKFAPAGPPVSIPADAVHTICNYEGMKVQIKNQQPFSGVVFVKNKFDSCRVEISGSDSATIVMGLPPDFGMKPIVLNGSPDAEKEKPENLDTNEIRRRRQITPPKDCGLTDIGNGTYKTIIVVQTNNLGIPGLEVSCDYSSMLGGKVSTAANMTVQGPTPSVIQPRGRVELGNPVLMQMTSKDGEKKPLIQAKLGEILELRWEIMAMDEELDFFVRECTAEPGSPDAREDEKLQLIEDGCPTPAVSQKLIPEPIRMKSSAVKFAHLQAFRFDSSPSIRVTCKLELCKGTCKPVTCNLLKGAQESWGRKKRSVEANGVNEFITKRYKVPRFAQATTSLMIIDPLQQVNEPQAQVAMNHQAPIELVNQEPEQYEREAVVPEGQMCMNKYGLLSILGTLLGVILVQTIVVGKHIFQRVFAEHEQQKLKAFY